MLNYKSKPLNILYNYYVAPLYSKLNNECYQMYLILCVSYFPGKPEISGMGSADGNGVLEIGTAGTASWLIIPYTEAAPTHDVLYDIGGTLYYTVGGQNITVPLFPDTITVTPDPRLYLNYFLERNVRSDDPMTEGQSGSGVRIRGFSGARS